MEKFPTPNKKPEIPSEWENFFSSDPYKVLDIPNSADKETIQKARNTLQKKFHPDINSHELAQEISQRINRAFDTLIITPDSTNIDKADRASEERPSPIVKSSEFITVMAERKVSVGFSQQSSSITFDGLPFVTTLDIAQATFEGPMKERTFVACEAEGWPEINSNWFSKYRSKLPDNIAVSMSEMISCLKAESETRMLFPEDDEHPVIFIVKLNESQQRNGYPLLYAAVVKKLSQSTLAALRLDKDYREHLVERGGFHIEWNALAEGYDFSVHEGTRFIVFGQTNHVFNEKEDMLSDLGLKEDQVAYSPIEIGRETKAYLGHLEEGIFERLKNVEHIYTQYPKGKVRRMDLEIAGQPLEELLNSVNLAGISTALELKELLKDQPEIFSTRNSGKIELVFLKGSDLGFKEGLIDTNQLYERAQLLGLELCQPSDVLFLAGKYDDQPANERLYLATEPVNYMASPGFGWKKESWDEKKGILSLWKYHTSTYTSRYLDISQVSKYGHDPEALWCFRRKKSDLNENNSEE